MSFDPGDSTSIWIDEERCEDINKFDAYYRLRDGPDYSLGDQIKEAMRLQLTVERALDKVDVDHEFRGYERRTLVRQAILDHFRKDD